MLYLRRERSATVRFIRIIYVPTSLAQMPVGQDGKSEHVKTVIFGGKKDVPSQYCGTVGCQSIDSATIDTEIK
jgi:hypothetical protein